MEAVTAVLDDATLTPLLGPKCPACGWRTGHRGGRGILIDPCPDTDSGETT